MQHMPFEQDLPLSIQSLEKPSEKAAKQSLFMLPSFSGKSLFSTMKYY